MALQQGVASAAFLAGSFWPFQAEHRTVAPTGLEATESCKGEYQKTSVVPFKNQRQGRKWLAHFSVESICCRIQQGTCKTARRLLRMLGLELLRKRNALGAGSKRGIFFGSKPSSCREGGRSIFSCWQPVECWHA